MPSPRPLLLLAPLMLSCFGARALVLDAGGLPPLDLGEITHTELIHTLVHEADPDGAALSMVVVGRDPERLEDRRGVLLVAGLDGRRAGDVDTLAATVRALDARDDLAERLGDALLVLVPRANPAGLAASPRTAGNGAPDDRDRDGRVDEDGPSDLDGDGRVLWMRVPDPRGEWVLDEHDPRALRKPDASKGERATHRVLREGLDDDGDGSFHEDDTSGTEPDRNFSHRWHEHDPGTGRYPLEAPESHALATLLLEHPGLLAVLAVGEADTLVREAGVDKQPRRGRFGGYDDWLSGLLEEDAATLKQLGARFADAVEGEHEVKGGELADGSLLAWAYHEAGRWPLGVTPWEVPKEFPPDDDATPEEDADDAEARPDTQPGAEPEAGAEARPDAAAADAADAGSEPGADAQPDPGAAADDGTEPEAAAASDDADAADTTDDADAPEPTTDPSSPAPAALIAWLEREGRADDVVDWTPFEHPQLGAVEIGGVDPRALFSGPWEAEARDAFAARLAAFSLDLLDDFPALAVENLEVEARGDGAYAVSLALVNTGRLPTAPLLGAEARTSRALRTRLVLPDGAARLAGPQEVLVDRLEGLGGRRELRWLIAGASPGDRLLLQVDADTVPDLEQEIVLP